MVFLTTQATQPARHSHCTKRARRPIKATPRHVGRDASVRSKSSAFLFNQISDTYWCSPRAHASRTGRSRALIMWAMADLRVLRETCMDLSITRYLQPSRAAADSPRMVKVFLSLRPAKLRSSRGMLYSAGHVGACGASAFISAGRTPKRTCGTLSRSPGHGPGGFAGRFAHQVRCGRFVSCRGVGAEYVRCLG